MTHKLNWDVFCFFLISGWKILLLCFNGTDVILEVIPTALPCNGILTKMIVRQYDGLGSIQVPTSLASSCLEGWKSKWRSIVMPLIPGSISQVFVWMQMMLPLRHLAHFLSVNWLIFLKPILAESIMLFAWYCLFAVLIKPHICDKSFVLLTKSFEISWHHYMQNFQT